MKTQPLQENRFKKTLFVSLSIVLFWAGFLFWAFSGFLKLPEHLFFQYLTTDDLFGFRQNSFGFPRTGIFHNLYFLLTLLCSSVSCAALLLCNKKLRNTMADLLATTLILNFFYILFFIMAAETMTFNAALNQTLHKTTEEKLQQQSGGIFYHAQWIKQHIQEPASARLISSLDFSRDPGMRSHRLLAFFLYPIDIREVRKEPEEYIIFFHAKNPQSNVPEGYEIIAIYDENNMIAGRKNKP
jgi:hypothetical protein